MKDNFDIVAIDSFPNAYHGADGKFWEKLSKLFGIGTGRRKQCKEQGLSGSEKRACVRMLKKSGWKKGQPIPVDMAGITQKDVVEAEKYPPLPEEVYVSPYEITPYTAITKESDELGLYTYYPEQPRGEVKGGSAKVSSWDSMTNTGKIATVVGIAGTTVVFAVLISNALKGRPKTMMQTQSAI